jgi:glycosyltransferase involved in cell wall biosynthesis
MRIAIVSKADRYGGGASRVAEDLCLLLGSKGHTAHHYVSSATELKPYMRAIYGGRRLRKLVHLGHNVTQRLGFQEIIPWEYFVLRLTHGLMDYDLVHFHDLSSAISPLTVGLIAKRLPTVWTFHDYAAFTGGCIFPMDCRRFQTGCGDCPQMDLWPLNRSNGIDFTRRMLKIKHKIFRDSSIHVIAPCEWMANTARSSGIQFKRITVIPYGIDTSVCLPLEKAKVRQLLDLVTQKPIVLLSAGDITDKRKGLIYSVQALKKLQREIDPFVLIVGKIADDIRRVFGDIEVFDTGYLRDDSKKLQYFAAADVFLFCPIDDNMPLTILETMATATPMVGFATGGIPEVVQHLRTGYLGRQGDINELVSGMQLALRANCAAEWGREARRMVAERYTHEHFLRRHLDLYDRVIVRQRGPFVGEPSQYTLADKLAR